MSRTNLLALFVLGILVAGGVALLQNSPGYMDADYYMAGALRLVQGHGFSEIILWNYLDDPLGLPHPSHSYWMPLASIVAAFGMWLTGQHDFFSARLPFIFLAGFVPPLTGLLAYRLSARRELALLSGLLAAFPPYQTSFIATTSNFVLYNLLGALFFLALFGNSRKNFFAIGLLAGLLNLARSDGLLWLPLAFVAVLLKLIQLHGFQGRRWLKPLFSAIFFILLGYFLVMTPWFLRNLSELGVLMASGGSRTLFLTSYNDTFAYPASSLTLERWLNSGWQSILNARLFALWTNLGTGFAAQGGIILWPFILLAAWRLRRDLRIQIGSLAWLTLFLVMTLVFPFAGPRGSFYHAGAALLPLGWSLAPIGLEAAVAAARRRNWFTPQAQRIFRLMVFAVILALTLALVNTRVITGGWDVSDQTYQRVEARLKQAGARPTDVIMLANPPGYYLASARPAVITPSADLDRILQAAKTYNVRYLALEPDSVVERLLPFLEQREDSIYLRLAFVESGVVVYEFILKE
ncbi:MAG: hypothetical protein RBS68_12955 [Anaerolineales bacterium]|nr:hypothetical protein [Anaerolineales bacterium]